MIKREPGSQWTVGIDNILDKIAAASVWELGHAVNHMLPWSHGTLDLGKEQRRSHPPGRGHRRPPE